LTEPSFSETAALLNREKVTAPTKAVYAKVAAELSKHGVRVFAASESRRLFSVEKLGAEVRRAVLDLGATVAPDRQFDMEKAIGDFARGEAYGDDPLRSQQAPGIE
jgi:hypothetical protein